MKKLLILFAAVLVSGVAHAQEPLFAMTYQMGLPVGNTSNYISTFSGRGFGIDYKGFVSPDVAVGGAIGWNVFYEEKDFDTYFFDDGNGAISGRQYRYINSFPILLTADYFFGGYGMPRGFVGAGVGTYRIYQRTDMGIFTVEPREWHFGICPEAGFVVPMGSGAHFLASLKYHYAFQAGDIDATSYLGINVGFAWN